MSPDEHQRTNVNRADVNRSPVRRADVERALDSMLAAAPVPTLDVAAVLAGGRRRVVRRRVTAIGVVLALMASIATVAETTGRSPRRRTAARLTSPAPATPTTIAITATAAATTTTVPSTPGGIIGCPTRRLTSAPDGDPPAGLVAAALHAVSAHSLWTGGTIMAVYRIGNVDAGAFGAVFVNNVRSCGAAPARNSWVVELHHPSGAQLSAVALAHYADGWHVFGSYS